MRVGEADCLRPVEAKGAQLGHVGCLEAKARSNLCHMTSRINKELKPLPGKASQAATNVMPEAESQK